ncbi:MAG: ferrous iron transport protein A [Magnetococcales bacterium]|nr:ferrous iron transport protein A [Magnetococcales bacterium]
MGKKLKFKKKTLADLKKGESGRVVKLHGDAVSQRRLMALGVVKGKSIVLEDKAPLGDPCICTILGYRLTLRNSDAKNIVITSP